jgi:hypothetical protein
VSEVNAEAIKAKEAVAAQEEARDFSMKKVLMIVHL